jgi:predicted ester cyclase
MSNLEKNKQIISSLIQEVWNQGQLDLLSDFWSEDCINYAMTTTDNCGLEALRVYHESLAITLNEAFINFQTEILQQVAEGETVVTQMRSSGEHCGAFLGIPATGKNVVLSAMRID